MPRSFSQAGVARAEVSAETGKALIVLGENTLSAAWSQRPAHALGFSFRLRDRLL